MMTRREALALSALAAILAVTAAWWALALWPAGTETPAWVVQTRSVCFGTRADGLPGPAGWLVLVGEPIGMLGFLLAAWGRDVRDGLRALGRSLPGRAILAGGVTALALGTGAAGVRVAAAAGTAQAFDPTGVGAAPARLDRPAPPLALLDASGDTVRLGDFAGRPVLVAFAYGHCQTVCPTLVREAVAALALAQDHAPALLVVTLDPWRDRMERLPDIAAGWELPANARLLGGSVEGVEAVLDAWGVVRERDPDTGDIIHPTQVYVVDRAGRLAWAAEADAKRLAALLTANAARENRHPG